MDTPDDMDGAEDVAEAKGYDTSAKPWLDLIGDAEKCFSTYQEKCDSIDKLYADMERMANAARDREFQIFWANLEVLKPSIYSRPPVPVVVPTFQNRKELPRRAADMLERSLITSFRQENFDEVMRLVRDDLATSARGVIWVRYEAEQGEEDSLIERVCYDHIDRCDFLHDPARKWRECDWVARRSWLTRDKGYKRFGEHFLEAEFREQKGKDDEYKGEKKAAVWELWHKTQNVVVWVSPGMDEVLDIQPPFLELENFFPCPMPAYGTKVRGSLKPMPDYLYYKDQIEEINELTARISALSEALRMKGFYAGGSEDLATVIETAMKQQDNNALLIPVPNFTSLGGQALKDAIVWLPIVEVASTVKELIALRQQVIQDVYEITGLSDIMRGVTQASETLGAQQLKSQYGSIRIRDRQHELVRIALDTARIAGEIMAENFQPQTLLSFSQIYDLPQQAEIVQKAQAIQMQVRQAASDPNAIAMAQQNPQQAQQMVQAAQQQLQTLQNTVTVEAVVELLRTQRVRPFVLDIETDSTIQPDEDAEKQRRTEFLTAIGGFINQAGPMLQQMPQAAPFVAEALKFTASGFRAGRDLMGVIEEFSEQIKEFAQQRQQGASQPSPEMMKMQAEDKAHQDKMQLEAMKAKDQSELEWKKAVLQAVTAIETAKIGAKSDQDSAWLNAQLEGILGFAQMAHEQTQQAQPEPMNG